MHLVFGMLASTLLARKRLRERGENRALSFWGVLEVRHELPGRVRLHCPSLMADVSGALVLQSELPRLPGVETATADSRSGSIVVMYDENRIDIQTVETGILKLLGLEKRAHQPLPASLTRQTNEILGAVNQGILDRSKGAVDLDFLVPTALMTYAAVRALSGSTAGLPAGFTLLWWAYMHMTRKPPEPDS